MRPPVAETRSMEQQLLAFCDQWIETRVAKVEKHRLAAERWRNQPGMQLCYEVAMRRQAHYQHEVTMLRELRACLLRTTCP